MQLTELQSRLQSAFNPTHLEVTDHSAAHAGHAGNSGGGHFDVLIVSPAFEGKNRVQRHQLVYQSLAGEFQRNIHALSLRTFTPSEFQAQ